MVADLQDIEEVNWYNALGAAESVTSEGYDDWYVPSIEELELMFNMIGQGSPEGNIGGFSSNSWDWSSTSELNNGIAKVVIFSNGNQSSFNKNETHWVRVIRAF